MARPAAKNVRVGVGAKFLNPQWDPKKGEAAMEGVQKWVTTGVHLSRYLAEQYVKKNFPYIPWQNVRIYGIRLPAEVFDPDTLAYLSRANARGFGSEK